jgi:hypothetical protein
MDQPHEHKLRFLHLESSLNRVKLEQLRRVATDVLKDSLLPGQRDSLKVRADGTVLAGHHRIYILKERGENIDGLPRQIMEKEP